MDFKICKQVIEGNMASIADCPFASSLAGGALGVLIAVGILVAILFLAIIYVYHAMAWMTIARKLKHKRPWLAWIPFASSAMRLQLGGFHWALVFLWLFPPAIIVLLIISHWRIFNKRKYPGWFSLAFIFPKLGGILSLVIIGFVAWKDRKKMLFK